MSAFDTNAPTDPNPITENFLDNLVGDGKKFVDPEALAKGKYEADVHVTNLERQLAEMREDLDQGAKITELMELVREQNKPAPKDQDKSPVVPGDTSSGQMTEDELKSLIEQHVSERDKQTSATQNITNAEKALGDKFGEAAGRVLAAKAAEVGMSVDDMKAIAGSNLKAFYRLMGLESVSQPDSGGLLGSAQRSEGDAPKDPNIRNFKYYQTMRKEQRAHYYSPKVQAQMMKDREAMGAEGFMK